ncbi:V-type ATPase V1 subunit H [Schizosaccharomyces japonicus yFS275]|uniref:V-type proton ATPase subunit H n=1 Tax=Schizosaccharomyces japonicus (strain yFS275 / FY16936) TaxID=402676 RepID=B6K877_SCHJY|nr:V-type ATPase V1 subunit H [Schizosaccharomyces japonicus yFS275]EEB09731.1 V-type ATPase V1 subunit H [Schizosaccharomyces japonicus yFS275]
MTSLQTMEVSTPPPAMLNNQLVDEVASNARTRAIPWRAYERSHVIDEKLCEKVLKLDGLNLDARVQVVLENGDAYTQVFLKMLQIEGHDDIFAFACINISDILLVSRDWANIFVPLFFEMLGSKSWIESLASDEKLLFVKLFALACVYQPCTAAKEFTFVLEYLGSLLSDSADTQLKLFAAQCVVAILYLKPHRRAFWTEKSCSMRLVEMLRTVSGDPQLLYYGLLNLWLLSFEPEIAKEMNKRFSCISLLAEIARADQKEKIYRIVLAIFVNLLKYAREENASTVLLERVDSLVKTLQHRKWSDEDLVASLTYLDETLAECSRQLSNFDIYKTEVESGHLHWSPSHRSEEFWARNVKKLNDDDSAVLKQLINILQNPQDVKSLAVACHDIGCYLQHYPEGRSFVIKYGAKPIIMQLMNHSNSEVRFEALSTVQRLMSQVWND